MPSAGGAAAAGAAAADGAGAGGGVDNATTAVLASAGRVADTPA